MVKRSPGRWRHVRYLRTSLALEQLADILREKFKWPPFEIGSSQGRRVASVDMGNMDVLVTELPERADEYNFQVTLGEDWQPVSVVATPSSLQPATLSLLNTGDTIGVCIQVISPIDATVLVDSVRLNLRL